MGERGRENVLIRELCGRGRKLREAESTAGTGNFAIREQVSPLQGDVPFPPPASRKIVSLVITGFVLAKTRARIRCSPLCHYLTLSISLVNRSFRHVRLLKHPLVFSSTLFRQRVFSSNEVSIEMFLPLFWRSFRRLFRLNRRESST